MQVRKLEFLLADALQQGCDCVLTCGSIQSNHSRATAMAARQLGHAPHLMLRCQGEIVSAFIGVTAVSEVILHLLSTACTQIPVLSRTLPYHMYITACALLQLNSVKGMLNIKGTTRITWYTELYFCMLCTLHNMLLP